MKFLVDFFPIILFFVAYKLYDIYVATAVAIVASFAQCGYFWLKHRRLETMHLVTLALVVVFGGATLLLRDESFIKWKFSIVNWLFGFAFLFTHYIGDKPLVKRLIGHQISLPETVWRRLNMSWVVYFMALGFANVYVMFNFDTDTWVNFKTFGNIGMTLALIAGQGVYMYKHMKHQPSN
ncbi:septation protein A [Kaarinaea lacus]